LNPTNGDIRRKNMSSGSEKDFENYARDCVRLAEQVDSPELREKLFLQAREWMQAAMAEEDERAPYAGRPSERSGLLRASPTNGIEGTCGRAHRAGGQP
jgi:hypothetical protein